MPSIPHIAFVGNAHIQRAHDTEGQQGVARNPDTPATNFAAKSANYGANNIVIAPRFDAIRRHSYRVPIAIHCHRIQIEYEIIVRSNSGQQLHA